MHASAAVSVLLVPVLVVGGGVAALAVASSDYEAHRVASVAYESAAAEADAAQRAALTGIDRYLALSADVKAEIEHVAALQAVSADKLDAATVAKLGPLLTTLKAAVPADAPTVPLRPRGELGSDPAELTAAAAELEAWSEELRSTWDRFGTSDDEAAAELRHLRTGILAVAGSVATTGKAILDATGSASAESRATLTAAMAHVANHIEEGTDPSADLAAYVTAAKAVQDSHAAAVAAAAATGSGGGRGNGFGGFPEGSYEEAYYLCHTAQLSYTLPDGSASGPSFPCIVYNRDGSSYTFYS